MQPSDQVALMMYSASVTLVDLASRRARAFPEFDPSMAPQKGHFVNSVVGIPSILATLGSFGHGPQMFSSDILHALFWAAYIMDGYGGRLILFTGGRTQDFESTILKTFLVKSISLSIFCVEPVSPTVETMSKCTGGIIAKFGHLAHVRSLFTTPTAWDAACSLRLQPSVSLTSVLGHCTKLEPLVVAFPTITSSQSVIFEIDPGDGIPGDLYFQMAFRYLDDAGVRKVRVINGSLPFVDVLKWPIDTAALGLFLNRNRSVETSFQGRVVQTRQMMSAGSLLPLFIYGGSIRDKNFVECCSVERFALSMVETSIETGNGTYRAIFGVDVTLVFPRGNEDVMDVVKGCARTMGIDVMDVFWVDTEDEFNAMMREGEEALRWYSELRGFGG
jgi:hypothetical protein